MRLVLWLGIIMALASAEEICFQNFNQEWCGDAKVMKGVVLKSNTPHATLQKRLKTPLKLLMPLKEATLFYTHSEKPLEDAKRFSKSEDVLYAYPDVIQHHHYASSKMPPKGGAYRFPELWQETYGKGVKIAIIDDGFNLVHEDFEGVDVRFMYDVDHKRFDISSKSASDHGTAVAGLVFAQHNGKGIDGIAPKSQLIALHQTTNRLSDTLLAFATAQLANADVVICSWNSPTLLEPVYDAIVEMARYGRDGKGAAMVFAAGNEGKPLTPLCIESAIPEVISVSATNALANQGDVIDFRLQTGLRSTQGDGYGFFGGTSALAPIVGGVFALVFAKEPHLTLAQAHRKVIHALRAYNPIR